MKSTVKERRHRAGTLLKILTSNGPRTATGQELRFISDMAKLHREGWAPTDKQLRWLEDLYERC